MPGVEPGNEIAIRINDAHEEQRLSDEALAALNAARGTRVLALGTPPEEFLGGRESFIVTLMPDDSTSLNKVVRKVDGGGYSYRSFSRTEAETGITTTYEVQAVGPEHPEANAEGVRAGHNAVLEALRDSENPGIVLFGTLTLNGRQVNPYGPLTGENAVQPLDTRNFVPAGGTALYDRTAELLGMVLAKYQQFDADRLHPRTATLIITDGRDEHSGVQSPESVAEIIKSITKPDPTTGRINHIVAAMGIDDGQTDFKKIFMSMGIPEQWILTSNSTKADIQKVCGVFAKAAAEATKSAAAFDRMLQAGPSGIVKSDTTPPAQQ